MPNPERSAHDFLVGALWPLRSIASIKLVARLHDPRIGSSDSATLHIFIGDMHMISRARIGTRYKSGFNHERMFVDMLKKIRVLKRSRSGFSLRVYQLGDSVDLWKEDLTDPEPVLNDYQGVRDYLFGPSRQTSVKCNFVLGNHDIEIAQNPNLSARWAFRRFIAVNGKPIVYLTHGDVFAWIESLPDSLKKWAVYHFSPSETKPRQGLGDIVDLRKEEQFQVDARHISVLSGMKPFTMDTLASQVNVRKQHRFLKTCFDRLSDINRRDNLHMNAAVIGHTHDAQIAVLEEGSKFFVLLDCGAWCGTYQAKPKPLPNCQIGVICGNDFRIYQLEADPAISPQFEPRAVL